MSILDRLAAIAIILQAVVVIIAFLFFFTPILTTVANSRVVIRDRDVVVTPTPTIFVSPTATPAGVLKSSFKEVIPTTTKKM